ncbi:hypothetical protein [Brucella intermedia]|uniref:hypothetical protein n=1 Tax=Brucella intermedia TaxID=94625 RepID=UPI0012D3534A|nr:hypothetical protein [Brucella intermedia]
MADSENSRTLPSRTHRNILAAVEEFLSHKSNPPSSSPDDDPAVLKWEIWQKAYTEFCQLCRLQQHIERKLLREVGEPYIELEVPGMGTCSVMSYRDIEKALPGPSLAEARAEANKRLKEHYAVREFADELNGYTRALEAESEASEREGEAAQALWDTPARSVYGAIAKLHALITLGVLQPDCDEFPWPPFRSVAADLLTILKDANLSPPCEG